LYLKSYFPIPSIFYYVFDDSHYCGDFGG